MADRLFRAGDYADEAIQLRDVYPSVHVVPTSVSGSALRHTLPSARYGLVEDPSSSGEAIRLM